MYVAGEAVFVNRLKDFGCLVPVGDYEANNSKPLTQ